MTCLTATGCFGNCLESMVRFFGAKIASKRHHSACGMRYIIAMTNLIEGSPQRHSSDKNLDCAPFCGVWKGEVYKKKEKDGSRPGPPRISLPVMGGYALTYDSNLDFILRRIAFMRS